MTFSKVISSVIFNNTVIWSLFWKLNMVSWRIISSRFRGKSAIISPCGNLPLNYMLVSIKDRKFCFLIEKKFFYCNEGILSNSSL